MVDATSNTKSMTTHGANIYVLGTEGVKGALMHSQHIYLIKRGY